MICTFVRLVWQEVQAKDRRFCLASFVTWVTAVAEAIVGSNGRNGVFPVILVHCWVERIQAEQLRGLLHFEIKGCHSFLKGNQREGKRKGLDVICTSRPNLTAFDWAELGSEWLQTPCNIETRNKCNPESCDKIYSTMHSLKETSRNNYKRGYGQSLA